MSLLIGQLAEAWDLIGRGEAAIAGELSRLVRVDTSFPAGDGYPVFTELVEGLLTPPGFAFRHVHAPDELTTIDNVVALARAILLYLGRDLGEAPDR